MAAVARAIKARSRHVLEPIGARAADERDGVGVVRKDDGSEAVEKRQAVGCRIEGDVCVGRVDEERAAYWPIRLADQCDVLYRVQARPVEGELGRVERLAESGREAGRCRREGYNSQAA